MVDTTTWEVETIAIGSDAPTGVDIIPTLNQWGMILLALILGGYSICRLKKKTSDA